MKLKPKLFGHNVKKKRMPNIKKIETADLNLNLFKPSVQSILFLLICMAFNLLGRYVYGLYSVPAWGDFFGTCMAAIAYGPIFGAAIGGPTNIILGIYSGP